MFTATQPGAQESSGSCFVLDKIRFRYFLLAAAVLHLAVTLTVFSLGRWGLMPNQFTENGIATFASDGLTYQPELAELAGIFKSNGPIAWATWPTQLHLRLYSIPFIFASRWTSFNILVIEPINLFYYLAILTLVFELGRTVFDRRSGLLAAAIVGLWPSLLLHTTQLLRDPLLITIFLFLIFCLIMILTRPMSLTRAFLWGLGGSLAIVMVRIVRLPMWNIIWVIVPVFICLLVLSQLRRRSVSYAKIVAGLLVIGTLLLTPRYQPLLRSQQHVKVDRILHPELIQRLPLEKQIAQRRHGFGLEMKDDGQIVESQAGSNLSDVPQFKSPGEILRYLPRAAVVGFFAPFPNMWISRGKEVGTSGRLLSGAETLLTYLIEAMALMALWGRRKSLSIWLLAVTAAAGVVALGLVVINIGALFRLRYPFWVLIVIIGATGIVNWKALRNGRRHSVPDDQ